MLLHIIANCIADAARVVQGGVQDGGVHISGTLGGCSWEELLLQELLCDLALRIIQRSVP